MGVSLRACGRCGAAYDDEGWSALERCGQMSIDDVRRFLTTLHRELSIDLRRCRACATVLARFPPSLAGPNPARA